MIDAATTPDRRPLLEARALRVGFGGRALLPEASFALRRGELWGLVGRNGGGKSTLLRTLLGLLPPVSGTVTCEARISYVPQRHGLDDGTPARVLDVVRGGLVRGWTFLDPALPWRKASRRTVDAALERTRSAGLAKARFDELSEGQKQRVLVARALASEPSLVVLDEPTSAMDVIAERAAFELLGDLAKDGLGILVATHRLSLVGELATHALLADRDGQHLCVGESAEVMASHELQSSFGTLGPHVHGDGGHSHGHGHGHSHTGTDGP